MLQYDDNVTIRICCEGVDQEARQEESEEGEGAQPTSVVLLSIYVRVVYCYA